ncbi:MAG: hypothetical protein ACOZAM_22080 [Pseudomonadota bacterium]
MKQLDLASALHNFSRGRRQRTVIIPKAYFEPENICALAEVLAEAKHRLNLRDVNDPATLDYIAARILGLAADGVPPWTILREIAPIVGEVPAMPASAIDQAAMAPARPEDGDGV